MSKRLLIIGFLVLLLVGVLGYMLTSRKPTLPKGQVLWQGVAPGTTTTSEVAQTLGQPEGATQKNGFSTLLYPSKNDFWKTEVDTYQDKVFFIREMVFGEETALENWTRERTTTPTNLYGDTTDSGFVLIVYPEEGIALVVHEIAKKVTEVWYFPKTTLQGFLQLPQASSYSNTTTTPQSEDF